MRLLGLAVLALAASPADASDTKPRKRQEPAKPCATWNGRVRGNDPDVAIKATLCKAKDGRVHGTIVWSGRSGSSTRAVSGTWSSQTLTLRDDRVAGTPNAGWKFCPIERYTLTQAGARKLEGTYRSTECRDDAAITLER
jgi:hypothetical protein